jgi:glycosyltransferase involved in cell wall biosynthesis
MEKMEREDGMKKIVNIVPYCFLPYSSGGQKLIASFNKYLGKETTLFVVGTKDNVVNERDSYELISILPTTRWRYISPHIPFQLIRFFRKRQIETIIIEHPYYGWMIPFFRLFTRAPIICHTHNVESERFRSIGKKWWRLLFLYEAIVLRHCDKILCITEEDRQFFIKKMNVPPKKCVIVPYGIEEKEPPSDKIACRKAICEKHQLDPSLPILFFNGALDYKPNTDALDIILKEIYPRLIEKKLSIQIVISGRNLPDYYDSLKSWHKRNILYTGFVADIDLYTKAADILLNPVISGGGVKTKMIEALGMNTTVISTESGAAGIPEGTCGNKLHIVTNNDWALFADTIIKVLEAPQPATPGTFYELFNWGNIIKKVLNDI